MTTETPFVSPYLLWPLRSYKQALRDREQAAASRRRDSLEGGGPTQPEAEVVTAAPREFQFASKTEEDSK